MDLLLYFVPHTEMKLRAKVLLGERALELIRSRHNLAARELSARLVPMQRLPWQSRKTSVGVSLQMDGFDHHGRYFGVIRFDRFGERSLPVAHFTLDPSVVNEANALVDMRSYEAIAA